MHSMAEAVAWCLQFGQKAEFSIILHAVLMAEKKILKQSEMFQKMR